jgi:hypothetical protein
MVSLLTMVNRNRDFRGSIGIEPLFVSDLWFDVLPDGMVLPHAIDRPSQADLDAPKLIYASRQAALFCRELLFDVGVHGVRKATMIPQNRISLVKNILLDKSQAAFFGQGGGCVPILVNSPFSQGHAVHVTLGD